MTSPSAEHEESDEAPTLETLADKVDKLADTVAGLVDKFHGAASEHEASKLDRPTREVGTVQQHAAGLQDEIRAELARLRQQEAHEQQHAELAAARTVPEQQPREYRRVERVMGWLTDDDR
jgi:hypothetical protein